jgi:hypothetical protein
MTGRKRPTFAPGWPTFARAAVLTREALMRGQTFDALLEALVAPAGPIQPPARGRCRGGTLAGELKLV